MKGVDLFRALSFDKKEKLIQIFTYKEISDIFKCSESTVSLILNDLKSNKHKETNNNIWDKVAIYKTKGAWMNSSERNFLKKQ